MKEETAQRHPIDMLIERHYKQLYKKARRTLPIGSQLTLWIEADLDDRVRRRFVDLLMKSPAVKAHVLAGELVKKAFSFVDYRDAGVRIGNNTSPARPPFNAEYVLYFLLRKEERDVVIGDLIEDYGRVLVRFNKRRADIWFYKQVAGSLLPLLRRALLRIGALVWLGRILRRSVS